jgi:mono/diheme cytochrome c family protein
MTPVVSRVVGPLVVGLSMVAVAGLAGQPRQDPKPAQEQVTAYVGSDLYRNYCAVCHGTSARGDGPLADKLKKRPPDLTQFAKQNGGTFPSALVAGIIDGRRAMPGHGGPDMPVWGDAFKVSQIGGSEEAVKARIDELVRYLATLQEKAGE